MLYLHCGWFKTGTTSLRNLLERNRERLEEAGTVYAPEWRVLTKSLSAEGDPKPSIREFTSFLNEQAGRDILYSNEWLTSLTWRERPREALLELIASAAEVMPVRCIWTLRRFDEAVVSLYLWQLARGERVSPVGRLGAIDGVEGTISGMRAMEEAAAAEVVYVMYEPGGGHNGELLRSFGLPAGLIAQMEREVARQPRLNPALSHKQAAALLSIEALSARSGVSLSEGMLRSAFTDGDFRFEADGPCALIGAKARSEIHRRALDAARETAFEPYLRFFGDVAIDEPAVAPDLSADALSEDDVGRLLEHVGSMSAA